MTDFNAHLSIASFAFAGLLIIAVTFNSAWQEIAWITVAIGLYLITALIHAFVREKIK